MNFSNTRKTGRLAELSVEELFTSWSWIVGQDTIDEGYDLTVEPDRTRYTGARFLVQVKGTSKPQKGKAITAPVSKGRLRDYLINPLPVIIVRASADGTLHWIHAQAWCQPNRARIASGNGECSVKIDKASRLEDREEFERFLDRVLAPSERRPGALAALAAARGEYLSSIDSRLKVRTSVNNGQEEHAILSTSEEPLLFKFQLRPLGDGAQRLKDAIDYGMPAELEVEDFKLTGSPLFDELGADGHAKGKLIIQPRPQKGFVVIRPGTQFSPFASELRFDADWTKGLKGGSIANQAYESALSLNLRLSFEEDGSGRANANIGFRPTLHERPIAELTEFSSIEQWANQIVDQGSTLIELNFFGRRASLSMASEGLSELLPWLPYTVFLGRLHHVAKALRSDFVVPDDLTFSPADVGDVGLAFALLKGERRRITVGNIKSDLVEEIDMGRPGSFHVRTDLLLSVARKAVGTIPVLIDLENYKAELTAPKELLLSAGEEGQAWISYCDDIAAG